MRTLKTTFTLLSLLSALALPAYGGTTTVLKGDLLDLKAGTTPSNPASGRLKLYPKSTDNKIYKLDSTGTESVVGSGAGGLYDGGQNSLLNSGWETDTSSWTASGGTYVRTTTAGEFIPPGVAAGSWDSSSAGQTLTSNAVLIGGQATTNGAFSCAMKCASGTCTHLLEITDGTNVVASTTITSSTTSFQRTTVNVPFASSGSYYGRIKSVAADEPKLLIDNCFLGQAESFNIGLIQPITLTTSYTPTVANLGSGTSTNAGRWSQVGDRMILTLAIWKNDAVAGTGSSVVTFSLPPGYTIDTSKTSAVDNGFGVVNTYGVTAASTYTTVSAVYASATTIQFSKGGAGALITGADMRVGSYIDGVISVPITQFSGSVQAFRPELATSWFTGYHSSDCSWAQTTTSLAYPTGDATCTFVTEKNVNMGTVISDTNGGNNSPGIRWTPSRSRDYWVQACFTLYGSTASAQISSDLQLYESGSYVTKDGGSFRAAQSNDSGRMCLSGTVSGTANTNAFAQIRFASSAGSAAIDQESVNVTQTVKWTVIALDTYMGAPILVGSVSSSAAGAERTEWLAMGTDCTASPCAAPSDQSSTSWFTNITRTSAGAYYVNVPNGVFSRAPSCTCSARTNAGTFMSCAYDYSNSTVNLIAVRSHQNGTLTDAKFNLNCQGPR